MDTAKDTTMQPATGVTIVPEATAEFIAGLLERIERLESDLATAEQDSRQKQARIERLEEEECKQAALLDCLNEWKALAKSAEKERDELRVKVEAMEKQEPVVYQRLYRDGSGTEDITDLPDVFVRQRPLYALPGAQTQPAPSVPTTLLVAVADLIAQMEIVSRVGFVDTPNDKDSCAAFCVAEGTWLELMRAVESLASALAEAPEAKP